jgi:hypothetical protein
MYLFIYLYLYVCAISGSHGGEYEDKNFWDMAPCSLVQVRESMCTPNEELTRYVLLMEALSTSATSNYFYETTRPTSQKALIYIC